MRCFKYLFFSWDPYNGVGQLLSPSWGSISSWEDLSFSLLDWIAQDLVLHWELSLHPSHVEAFVHLLMYFPFHIRKFVVWPKQSSFLSSILKNGKTVREMIGVATIEYYCLKTHFSKYLSKKFAIYSTPKMFKWSWFSMFCCGYPSNQNEIFSKWEWGNLLLHPECKTT